VGLLHTLRSNVKLRTSVV